MALKIALGDLTHLNDVNRHNYYVPLPSGYLAAYAKQRFGKEVDIRIIKDPRQFLDYVADERPQIVGLGDYYWKSALNRYVAGEVKRMSPHTAIIVGGPNIDSDHAAQETYLLNHPHYDAIVPREGEEAFANYIEMMLGNGPNEWGDMSGVVARRINGSISRGSFINLATDLSKVPSPYLTGLMDEWLDGTWQPMLQTSRLCPYTCAFCTSGKDRGKLRAFPIEQTKAEIDYVVQHFRGDRDTLFYIVDDNFGILERDIEIADHLRWSRDQRDYPRRIYFYNDKRFTHIARSVHERVGPLVYHGVCLSLQSENPEALKAIARRNLTDEQVVSALAWAKGLGFKTSTELIFGLPGETLESYCKTVDKCARLGFDVVNSYNLILFDGIEMNRPKYREQYQVMTEVRAIRGSITHIDGRTIQETEEVVISATGFTPEDFVTVRVLNILLKMVYALGVEREFFTEVIASGRSLSAYLLWFAIAQTVWTGWDEDDLLLEHAQFTKRLHACARQGYDPEDPDKANIFLPPSAYQSPHFRARLNRALASFDARFGGKPHANPHAGREGSGEVLRP